MWFKPLEKLIMEKTARLQKDVAQHSCPLLALFSSAPAAIIITFSYFDCFFFFLNFINQCHGTLTCSIKPYDEIFMISNFLNSCEAHQSKSCVQIEKTMWLDFRFSLDLFCQEIESKSSYFLFLLCLNMLLWKIAVL